LDNIIVELKEKLDEVQGIIAATTQLRKQQRGKGNEEKEEKLNEVISKKYPEFLGWHRKVGKIVGDNKLYYNMDLKEFTYPFPKLEFKDFSDVGGFIDGMDNCLRNLEDAIALFEHRDAIGLSREFGEIEGDVRLTDPDYEGIIDAIYRYGIQMSRTVVPYIDLHEEPIRFTILNALNLLYKGIGSGETFNKGGKTDICIRVGDVNIFVAECKVLHSAVKVYEGLEQLLKDYTTVYDDKVALIVFNSKYDSSVAFKDTEEQTNKFFKDEKLTFSKSPLDAAGYDYTLRYITTHPLDQERELTLTVMVINFQKRLES